MIRSKIAILAAVVLAATPLVSQAQQTPADTVVATRTFEIPASPLPQAIAQYESQSGVRVQFDSGGSAALTSRAVSGTLTTEAALKQLLDGTGIRYRFMSPLTVALVSVRQQGAPTTLATVRVS
ncbi:MAG: STN domain-containing protein, partial [Gemmatimonadaceae bacterium]